MNASESIGRVFFLGSCSQRRPLAQLATSRLLKRETSRPVR
ncbi:hypothetical protein HMPREF1249_0859 [Jonquetella sp. BV3C21]|nr:hypothetical protein GCWU000246_00220 [Jonquetella anthropi E3_33 E1]ERL24126.1 hypothetical protein HMPREF1249_0859 [Jonquetella sp. BV3C21]